MLCDIIHLNDRENKNNHILDSFEQYVVLVYLNRCGLSTTTMQATYRINDLVFTFQEANIFRIFLNLVLILEQMGRVKHTTDAQLEEMARSRKLGYSMNWISRFLQVLRKRAQHVCKKFRSSRLE